MDHLDSIRTFLRVAEVENFSEAARQLGVPKSLVTRRIAHLEKTLGAQLLVRTTRRVRLSEAGSLYRQHVAGVLDELDTLEAGLSADQLNLRGLMRISSPTAFGLQALRPVLSAFMREHPGLVIDLVLNDQPVNPAEEGYDLVISHRAVISGQFQEEPLFRFDVICCASPAYLEQRGVPQVPADLRQHDCIQYLHLETGHEWVFTRGGERFRAVVHPRLASNSDSIMFDAALDGDGIALLPHYICGAALAAGRLVEVLPGYEHPQRLLKAVLPLRRELAPRSRQLLEFLRESVARVCPERGAQRPRAVPQALPRRQRSAAS